MRAFVLTQTEGSARGLLTQRSHHPASLFRKAMAVVTGELVVDQLDSARRLVIAESPATSSVASSSISGAS
jgi:hypothetical protein